MDGGQADSIESQHEEDRWFGAVGRCWVVGIWTAGGSMACDGLRETARGDRSTAAGSMGAGGGVCGFVWFERAHSPFLAPSAGSRSRILSHRPYSTI